MYFFSFQVQRFSLSKQIELFMGVQDLIREKIGTDEANKFFEDGRYVVALGSNDFINNYLMPVYKDSWTYNDQSFVQYLMDTFRGQLTVMFPTKIYFYFYFLPFFKCKLVSFQIEKVSEK